MRVILFYTDRDTDKKINAAVEKIEALGFCCGLERIGDGRDDD